MSSTFGGASENEKMHEQFVFPVITIFGVLTILFLSLITCGKGRVPTTSASKNQKSKYVKETDDQKSLRYKKSYTCKTENSRRTQNESSKMENSQSPSSMSKHSVAADSKQPQKSVQKKITISRTQEGSEFTQASETVDNTQASSTINRSTKEIPAAGAGKKVVGTSVKEKKGLPAMDIPSNRSSHTARQQQPSSNRVATTQNSTKDDDHHTSQKQSQKQKSADQIVQPPPPSIPAIPPPRNLERDKELAAKALLFLRARRAQNLYSNRERNREPKTSQRDEMEEKEPEVRDNPEEQAQVLSTIEEDGNNKQKSVSFPTIDTPDIIPGQKIVGAEEIEKEAVDEESKKEMQNHVQAGIYVPPEKRQFRPCSEIPSDDLTMKREVRKKKKKKKKKEQKKKSKKKSDSSSDDK